MLKNYFKIAWRNLRRNKAYAAINIGGLAVGMAVAILIGMWVWDEISYNHYFKNYERIAQINNHYTEPLEHKQDYSSSMPQPMAKVLREKYGHIFKYVVLVNWEGDYTISYGDNRFIKKGQFIEEDAAAMFSLKMLRGSYSSLNETQGTIISRSLANTLFGSKEPINQIIKLNNKVTCKVTGVYEDAPANTILGGIQFLANFENLKANWKDIKENENNWHSSSHRIFVQLADNVNSAQANAAIKDFYFKDAPADFKELASKYQALLYANPMKNWYLYSEFKDGYPSGGRISYVWLFGAVGVFVLLLACINFINLSTARSEKRAKDVGVRKAIGSMKWQLVYQFLIESLLVVLLSFAIALLLVSLCITSFNGLADKTISLPFGNIYFWMGSTCFVSMTALLAGLYPAFYLSSFQPVKVLKGTFRLGKYASLPRKVLVTIQFSVSVILIIATIVVYRQIQFAQNRPVGYNRESVVRISMDDPGFANNKPAIRNELLASGLASHVGFSNSPVTGIWDNWDGFTWKGKHPDAESRFAIFWIDEDYGNTIQWKLLRGRTFSKEFGADSSAVVVNKSAAAYMGLKEPVGEFITNDASKERKQIIGVVDDIVAESPYEPVRPCFYWLEKNLNALGQMQVKINPDMSLTDALKTLEAVQKKFVPSAPFIVKFVNEDYAEKFKAEQRIGKLATLFALLAIFISCLGLFGLASFVAEQRTKEIGIRKVLGASVANLWKMLSKDFLWLVVISCVIASPVSFYFMNNWLKNYNYRTPISWWVFIAAASGALLITLLTVSYQAIKAALANPVKSLRSE